MTTAFFTNSQMTIINTIKLQSEERFSITTPTHSHQKQSIEIALSAPFQPLKIYCLPLAATELATYVYC